MKILSFIVLIRQLNNRLFVCRRDFFPNTHIGLFIYDFMGFDCFLDSVNKNTKLVLIASISDSLVNDQILSEISKANSVMLAIRDVYLISRFLVVSWQTLRHISLRKNCNE